MGIVYSVSCRDCKVTRDLDKFDPMAFRAGSAAEVRFVAEVIAEQQRHSYSAALLATFMAKHSGHNCTVFNEYDEALNEELRPFRNQHGVKTDFDYFAPDAEAIK